MSGDGFVEMDRGGFKALGIYNQLGPGERTEVILDRMQIPNDIRLRALAVWEEVREDIKE